MLTSLENLIWVLVISTTLSIMLAGFGEAFSRIHGNKFVQRLSYLILWNNILAAYSLGLCFLILRNQCHLGHLYTIALAGGIFGVLNGIQALSDTTEHRSESFYATSSFGFGGVVSSLLIMLYACSDICIGAIQGELTPTLKFKSTVIGMVLGSAIYSISFKVVQSLMNEEEKNNIPLWVFVLSAALAVTACVFTNALSGYLGSGILGTMFGLFPLLFWYFFMIPGFLIGMFFFLFYWIPFFWWIKTKYIDTTIRTIVSPFSKLSELALKLVLVIFSKYPKKLWCTNCYTYSSLFKSEYKNGERHCEHCGVVLSRGTSMVNGVRVKKVVGVIGSAVELKKTGDVLYVRLWDGKTARNVDIDELEIREGLNEIDYNKAIDAVVMIWRNDLRRGMEYFKSVVVVIRGKPPLSENAKRILGTWFGSVKAVGR